MDTLRYWLALLVVAGAPGIYLFWFSIHPFVAFWRRVGARRTLAIHYALLIAVAVVVVLLRRPIMAADFGPQPILVGLGLVLLVLAAVLRVFINRRLSNTLLQGLAELDPERYGSKLVTEGIYAHVRHPRYLQLVLAYLAYALITNYLAVWIVCGLTVIWVLFVVPIEERELRQRFGKAYERYCRNVPRLLPRLRIDD